MIEATAGTSEHIAMLISFAQLSTKWSARSMSDLLKWSARNATDRPESALKYRCVRRQPFVTLSPQMAQLRSPERTRFIRPMSMSVRTQGLKILNIRLFVMGLVRMWLITRVTIQAPVNASKKTQFVDENIERKITSGRACAIF